MSTVQDLAQALYDATARTGDMKELAAILHREGWRNYSGTEAAYMRAVQALHKAGWRYDAESFESAEEADSNREAMLDAVAKCGEGAAAMAELLHAAGYRRHQTKMRELAPLTPYERAAAAIDVLAKCMKEDQSLRLLGADDAEVKGLTLMEKRRRTTKF